MKVAAAFLLMVLTSFSNPTPAAGFRSVPKMKTLVLRGQTAKNLYDLMDWVYKAQKKTGTFDFTVGGYYPPGIQSHNIPDAYFTYTLGRTIDCGFDPRGHVCGLLYEPDNYSNLKNKLAFRGFTANRLCLLLKRRHDLAKETSESPPTNAEIITCNQNGESELSLAPVQP